MLKNNQTLVVCVAACEQWFVPVCVCVCLHVRVCVFPLHIRGSGSCVKAVYRWPAGQQLYREVEARQARFKYLRGSDGAELSNPSFSEDPSEAFLSQSSFHRFTRLSSFSSATASVISPPLLSLSVSLCSYLSFVILPSFIPSNLYIRDFFIFAGLVAETDNKFLIYNT